MCKHTYFAPVLTERSIERVLPREELLNFRMVFRGPQGAGFFKGDHTANTMVCVEKGQRCAVVLSNDVRAEAGFAELVRFLLGETGAPYDWEYGDYAGKS